MKKVLTLALTAVLCLGLVFMTGCGGGNLEMPYSGYDLTEYVTLPDYDSYTTEKPDVTITIEKDGEVVKETTLENLEASQVKDINIKENTEGTLGLQVTYDDSFETVQTEISIETE